LPNSIEAIEAGRGDGQQSLLPPEPVDDSRQGRIARLCSIPGVVTANRIDDPVAMPRISAENAVLLPGVAESVVFQPEKSPEAGAKNYAVDGNRPAAVIQRWEV
jgi:hypothetical protein